MWDDIKYIIASQQQEIILFLYIALVWSVLAHCMQFWAPLYKKNIRITKNVQTRETKLVAGLEGMFCGVRLRTLVLLSLVQSRLRSNLTALCSFLGRESRERYRTLLPVNRACRGSTKLHQQRLTLNIRKNFFTMRVFRHWNSFPVDVPSLSVLRGIWTVLSVACFNF